MLSFGSLLFRSNCSETMLVNLFVTPSDSTDVIDWLIALACRIHVSTAPNNKNCFYSSWWCIIFLSNSLPNFSSFNSLRELLASCLWSVAFCAWWPASSPDRKAHWLQPTGPIAFPRLQSRWNTIPLPGITKSTVEITEIRATNQIRAPVLNNNVAWTE